MEQLTSTELAIRLHRSERTVQRWIRAGKLQATALPDGRYAVESGAIDAIVNPVIPLAKTDEILTRLEAIEHHLQTLYHEIMNLSQALHMQHELLRASLPIIAAQSPQIAPTPQQAPQRHPGSASEVVWLTPELVGWRSFARVHGIEESKQTKVQNAIKRNKLPVIRGSWRIGKVLYTETLDEMGRARFYELFHTSPEFIPCSDCPHS